MAEKQSITIILIFVNYCERTIDKIFITFFKVNTLYTMN